MMGRARELERRIGERVRLARLMRGMSQTRLAHRLGVTFQQVHKYEMGQSRVSASALLKIAEALEVDIMFFYRDIPPASRIVQLDFTEATAIDFEILRSLMRIRNRKAKRSIAILAERLEDAVPTDEN